MDTLVINGGNRLVGEICMSGAKNAALPLLLTAILTDEVVVLENVPDLWDVSTCIKLLRHLGVSVERDGTTVTLHAATITSHRAPYELVKTMRASVLVMGPLLARIREAEVSLPGGCAIGQRPIDQHIKFFEHLGAKAEVVHGYVHLRGETLKGTDFIFDLKTVTGTMNALLAAVLTPGKTVLRNCAEEPEVGELVRCLRSMGAHISGDDTETIVIEGVHRLRGTTWRVIPDRIETGTYLAAVAATGGDVMIRGCQPAHLSIVLDKFREAGCEVHVQGSDIALKAQARPKAVDIITAPYPGYPTDMQAQFMALMCFATGTSVITETIFENRFMHVGELQRMGASLRPEGRQVIVEGVASLSGAEVMATDLRASASLVIAALAADGKTQISRVYHLDRGYDGMVEKLTAMGGEIHRVSA